jgi:tetratricopeptide (TPR) repeat protein
MKSLVCLLSLALASGLFAQAPRRIGTLLNPASRQYVTLADTTQPPWDSLPVLDMRPAGPAGGTVSVDQLLVPKAALKEIDAYQHKLASGKIEESAKHLEKALLIYPNLPAAHYNLGLCYAKLRAYDKAAVQFQAAAEGAPKLVEPWINLGSVYFLDKRYPDGEAAARRALDLDPLNPTARYLLGRILALEGQNGQETIDLLTKSKTNYPVARLILASVLLKRNQVPDAISELRAYLNEPSVPEKEKVTCMVERLTAPGTSNCAMN